MVDFKDLITNDGSPDVRGILESLSKAVVSGTTADTNIAITGIKMTAKLFLVLELAGAGVDVTDMADQTANCSVTSAGNLQCTADTSGDKLLVLYFNTD